MFIFFDKPTIGYCKQCECTAMYTDHLRCPYNPDHKLSIFIWDEESEYPE
jgi:hypothetical protein